jgi:hypothetical protein
MKLTKKGRALAPTGKAPRPPTLRRVRISAGSLVVIAAQNRIRIAPRNSIDGLTYHWPLAHEDSPVIGQRVPVLRFTKVAP